MTCRQLKKFQCFLYSFTSLDTHVRIEKFFGEFIVDTLFTLNERAPILFCIFFRGQMRRYMLVGKNYMELVCQTQTRMYKSEHMDMSMDEMVVIDCMSNFYSDNATYFYLYRLKLRTKDDMSSTIGGR